MEIIIKTISGNDPVAKQTITQHWKQTWHQAGYTDETLRENWQEVVETFLEQSQTQGLHPKSFAAFGTVSGKTQFLGSVQCQIFAGPLPWVVQSNVFRLGAIWGLYVTQEGGDMEVRQQLLQSALKYLHSLQCVKVVTLAPSQAQRDDMVKAKVGLESANMLTLDLTNLSFNDEIQNKNGLDCGPAGAEFDETVCHHWKKMWEDVGIPYDALVPNMQDVTCAFLQVARKQLHYQTFLARCPATGTIVGSVSCQVFEGPFPLIVKPKHMQLGTIWAVYVDPAYRRQGIATTLMKQALLHLENVGCDMAILIAASEAGQRCYERLGFRPNNALVCDVQSTYLKKENEIDVEIEEKKDEVAEITKQGGEQIEEEVTILREALKHVDCMKHLKHQQAIALRTATLPQLMAIYGDHRKFEDIIRAVFAFQKQHGLFVDPEDNWFTQNLSKFGRGFDMKQLQNDASKLASKFDRLSAHYDHWTVGNKSQVESFIVDCAELHPELFQNVGSATRVLDVACGIGLQGQVLRLLGFQGTIVGIDISSGMVDRTMKRGCYDSVHVVNANEDILSLLDADASQELFDIVICTGAMELLDQPKALAHFAKVMSPNAELWVSFQLDSSDKGVPNSTGHQHVKTVTKQDARTLLRNAGFRVHSMRTCSSAFFTPSKEQDGTVLPVPYLFVVAQKED